MPNYSSLSPTDENETSSPSPDGKPTIDCNRASLEQDKNLRTAQLLLYLSHLFSQFSEKTWQFALVLFLAAMTSYQSLLLVSTYLLCSYAASTFLGSSVGRFLDVTNRMTAARFCILVENCSVLLATICCCAVLSIVQHKPAEQREQVPTDAVSVLLIVGIHVFGSLAQVLDQGFVVAIERDWIVVLSQQVKPPGEEQMQQDGPVSTQAETWLSQTNVTLRQIYLCCKVLAPAAAGWIVGRTSHSASQQDMDDHKFCQLHGAAVLIGISNITSLMAEYLCTSRVYHLIPALAVQKTRQQQELASRKKCNEKKEDDGIDEELTGSLPTRKRSPKNGTRTMPYSQLELSTVDDDEDDDEEDDENSGSSIAFGRGLHVYMQQSVAWGGLAWAFLGLNALTFGGFMTTFLLWKGMSVEEIGLWRGIASFTGLIGTVAYKVSAKTTTVVVTGEWSIVYLFGCLTIAVASFFVQDYRLSLYMLVVSSAASRIGLWVFDISITMLFQEHVPDGIRGIVGGTQQAMSSFFTMTSGFIGIFFRRPEQFWVFAVAGYVAIGIAMTMYTVGVYGRAYYLLSSSPAR